MATVVAFLAFVEATHSLESDRCLADVSGCEVEYILIKVSIKRKFENLTN